MFEAIFNSYFDANSYIQAKIQPKKICKYIKEEKGVDSLQIKIDTIEYYIRMRYSAGDNLNSRQNKFRTNDFCNDIKIKNVK